MKKLWCAIILIRYVDNDLEEAAHLVLVFLMQIDAHLCKDLQINQKNPGNVCTGVKTWANIDINKTSLANNQYYIYFTTLLTLRQYVT